MQELRIARSKAGMTLMGLEAASGVGASTISKIERGVSQPQATTLHKLADALGVEVSELYPKDRAPSSELAPLSGPKDERRESNPPEAVDHDPYRWVLDKSTEELEQIGLEEAQYTKAWPREEWLAEYEADKKAWLEKGHRRGIAPPLIRNIIGELELRGASAAVKTIKLAIKQHDEVMNPAEETPQQNHEEQEGRKAG